MSLRTRSSDLSKLPRERKPIMFAARAAPPRLAIAWPMNLRKGAGTRSSARILFGIVE